MLKQWIRVVHSDNGVLTDKSLYASNGTAFNVPLVVSEDYIYVGQFYPFTNLYIEAATGNSSAATLGVEYWDSSAWRSGVDVLDGTASGSAMLGQSGVVQWMTDKDYSWEPVEDTSDTSDGPAALTGITVYNQYWMRIKASASLASGTYIKRVAYAFTSDAYLSQLDPEVDEYLTPWGGASKTNWDEQILIASEQVVTDLRARQFIQHRGQVILLEDLWMPTAYKTLELIYSQLGDSFSGKLANVQKKYTEMMNSKRWTFDQDKSGRIENWDLNRTIGKLVR